MDKLSKVKLPIICWTSSFLGALLVLALCGICPFGEYTLLTGDLNGIYNPFYSWLGQSLRDSQPIYYSFFKALGGGTQGLTMNIPIGLFLPLLAVIPREDLPLLHSALFVLRIASASAFFSLYIGRVFKPKPLQNIAISWAYAFMAYTMVYSQNSMWMGSVVLLPLALLTLERIIDGGSGIAFGTIVACLFIFNYYTAFMVCFFLITYFFYRSLCLCVAPGELWKRFISFAFFGVLGFALSGIVTLPSLVDAFVSKGLSAGIGSFESLWTYSIGELGRQLMWYTFSWDQVEAGAPAIYCSVLCFVAAVLYFAISPQTKREKLLSGGMLLLLLFSTLFAPLNRFWHLLKDPVWFPYRYSFVISAAILILCAQLKLEQLSRKKILLSLVSLAVSMSIVLAGAVSAGIGLKLCAATLLLSVGYAVLLFVLSRKQGKILPHMCSVALLFVLAIELILNSSHILSLFEMRTVEYYRSSLDSTGSAVAFMQKDSADGEFWRAEKDSYFTLNDPMLFNYNGLNYFTSVQDQNNVNILRALGYGGNYLSPASSLPAADSLLRLRYFFSLSEHDMPLYEEAGSAGGYNIYKNNTLLPTGILLEDDISWKDYSEPFSAINAIFDSFAADTDPVFYDISHIGAAEATVKAGSGGMLYIFCDPKLGASLAVNDAVFAPYFDNQPGIVFAGEFDSGSTVTIEGANCEIIAVGFFSEESFASSVGSVQSENPQRPLIDGLLSLEIEAETGGNVMLPIPYINGLSCTVNGNSGTIKEVLCGFAAVEISEGINQIVLFYSPIGFKAGLLCSLLSASCFAAILFIRKRNYAKD